MSVLDALILGIVQGLTEFLPVSSSGHLVLGQALLGIELPGVTFEVVVHVATLCAVCWVYRMRLAELTRGALTADRTSLTYIGVLALATVPAAIVGVGLGDTFADAFERPTLAAALLLVTGGFVWSIRRFASRATRTDVGVRDAVAVGLAQALAILPGISRSGSTVAVGTAGGVEPKTMAEFSFLLSIPVIAGAAVLQLADVGEAARVIGTMPLVTAFAASALSGVLAIRIFLSMLERRLFHRFAYYCWIVGAGYLLASWFVPTLR